jgi:hypothetical protein
MEEHASAPKINSLYVISELEFTSLKHKESESVCDLDKEVKVRLYDDPSHPSNDCFVFTYYHITPPPPRRK